MNYSANSKNLRDQDQVKAPSADHIDAPLVTSMGSLSEKGKAYDAAELTAAQLNKSNQ